MSAPEAERMTQRFRKAQVYCANSYSDPFVGCVSGGKGGGEGGTLGITGWGCATGTLAPLTYTRASSDEFCYPILE